MKKNINLLIGIFIFTNLLIGEEFSFTSEKTSLTISPVDTSIVMTAIVKNTSNQNLDIQAIRTTKQIPRSWGSSMCFGLCYGEQTNETNAITFYPNDEITFELDVYIDDADEGLAKIDIKMEASNGESITIEFDIISSSTAIKKNVNIAEEYILFDNYPNPFNPETTIKYSIPEKAFVEISVFDILGNHVSSLIKENKSEGLHIVSWNGMNDNGSLQSAGIYYYQMNTMIDGKILNSSTKKMVLVK